jgi:hypothetical protein
MSEYQYIGFRAVEKPVSGEDLKYMRQQSSRAEITPWSFDNEYHFGDFHGDALTMLRRGYDIHLHYANFGIRKLLIRLPRNLPDTPGAMPYFTEDGLHFHNDKHSQSGILSVDPSHEPGDQEELWEVDDLLDRLVPLRAEILEGNLRPPYLAHLAMMSDAEHDPEETTEGPVPAGLGNLTAPQRALTELFGLSNALIAAAAKGNSGQFGLSNALIAAAAKGTVRCVRARWAARAPGRKPGRGSNRPSPPSYFLRRRAVLFAGASEPFLSARNALQSAEKCAWKNAREPGCSDFKHSRHRS